MDNPSGFVYDGFNINANRNNDMGASNFCGFKTAYLLTENFGSLTDLLVDDEELFWKEMTEMPLPKGWTFTGTDISGAAGYVVTFDISGYPTPAALRKLDRALKALEAKYAAIAEENAELALVFNSDILADWSVYELTNEMIEEATKLWYWGDMSGDYGAIAERLGIDRRTVGDETPWVMPS